MLLALILNGWLAMLINGDSIAETASTLLLLVAGVLVVRIFRERYLFFWIIGWCAYLLYNMGRSGAETLGYPPGLVSFTYGAFFACTALFVAAVFDYVDRKRWLLPLAGLALVGVAVAITRAFWLPNSFALGVVFQILYRIGTLSAALELVAFNRGRRALSAWLMAAMLLLVHVNFDITRSRADSELETLVESLLGLSMLVLLLDDTRTRSRRLDVFHHLMETVANAPDEKKLTTAALEQISRFFQCKAAWLRLVNDETLVVRAHSGLPASWSNQSWVIPPQVAGTSVFEMERPIFLQAKQAGAEIGPKLREENLNHVVFVPVPGKTAILGAFALGFTSKRNYRAEERRFLVLIAKQIGIAIENLELISKILRSQRQWANTFDALPDPILVHDDQFRVIKVNRALINKVGHSLENIVGRQCDAVLPRFGGQWTNCPYCSAQSNEFHDALDPCFGGYSIVSTTTYSGDETGPGGTVHIIRDTTARRAAEERYRTLFEQVQEGVFISTPDGRIVDCNDAFVRMLGYDSREEVLARGIAETYYSNPSDRNVFLQKMEKEGMVRNFEMNLRRKDGSKMTVLENSYATRTASGHIIRYHGVLLDITEKKRAEDEIHRRNRELEALNAIAVLANQSFDLDEIVNVALRQLVDIFHADSATVLLTGADHRVVHRCTAGHDSEFARNFPEMRIPDAFWDRLMSSHVEILTQRDRDELPPEFLAFVDAEKLQSWAWVVMWGTEKIVGGVGISSRKSNAFTSRDEGLMIGLGRQLANSIERVRLYDETSKAYETLQRAQEQLLQSEKMSAVGQLISGVAHELNNPLTAILGYAQLLEGEDLSERSREYVAKLYKQTQRTHRVVQNLLSFARQRKPAKMPVDLRRVVEDTLALRDYDLNLHNIVVNRNFAESLPAVVADAHQLEQVFLNIINNAVDAMLEHARGGTLDVSIIANASHVSVEFHDSGPGIRELNRIFDPFYTTKAVGKGTGLGLSICYGIVKEHGGDIRAFNHPRRGAVIQVVLPASVSAEPLEGESKPLVRAIPLCGRVLIVDDEEAVLEFERDVLSGAGAEVVMANSGEDAIAKMGREVFDAILVDSSMPGKLNGLDVYRWAAEHRPQSANRIVLTLSNMSDGEVQRFVEDKSVRSINKPFEVSDLIVVTAQAMQRDRTPA